MFKNKALKNRNARARFLTYKIFNVMGGLSAAPHTPCSPTGGRLFSGKRDRAVNPPRFARRGAMLLLFRLTNKEGRGVTRSCLPFCAPHAR